ncbi:type II secretion system F family protein [Actimicrobium sp. CCC2.4]|uniref:type II secretion system F family protein n=1 Tax=Actimicrobium sp. CCC2.4 TaxID=3048606 RepID=UPI002AC99681|nr:type II secretion system F family protein [Actimicrobium sp. CCC2.4]MEB0136603.1 type II secretion system F family protein [Actimicrobium sp. CCC2.4]WPX31711.1 type II secretion system F family protein [Actimicrobium sp. CCC2.4]
MTPLSHSTLIFLLALAIGLSVALIGWLLGRSVAEVPTENRDYKDAPPLAFRLAWWPIQWISYYLALLGIAPSDDKSWLRMRRAGLDYMLTPSQFLAGCLLCMSVTAVLFCWLLYALMQARVGSAPLSTVAYGEAALSGMVFGWVMLRFWLHDRIALRQREILKSLPFFLDIVTLCVEAGLNLQGALSQSVDKGPPGAFRDECQRVLRDVRAGKARAEALRAMAERLREPGITSFVTSVIQAESMGMNLGPVLRAQADQRRTERFQRAEKKALEAPVKLLLPLIVFIFPCTFIVLFFPIAMQFLHAGS